jgi:hypothetical protein
MADGENKEPQQAEVAAINGTAEGEKKDDVKNRMEQQAEESTAGEKRSGDAHANEQASKKIKTEGEDGGKAASPKKAIPSATKPPASADDDDDDDKPLAAIKKAKVQTPTAPPKKPQPAMDDSDDDEPIVKLKKVVKSKTPVQEKPKKKKQKEESSSDDSSSDSSSDSDSDSDDGEKKKKVPTNSCIVALFHFVDPVLRVLCCLVSLASVRYASDFHTGTKLVLPWRKVPGGQFCCSFLFVASIRYAYCDVPATEVKIIIKSTEVSKQAEGHDIV